MTWLNTKNTSANYHNYHTALTLNTLHFDFFLKLNKSENYYSQHMKITHEFHLIESMISFFRIKNISDLLAPHSP